MLGEGIVSFGTAVLVMDFKNLNASPKIVSSRRALSAIFRAAVVKKVEPSLFLKATSSCSSLRLMPPSW